MELFSTAWHVIGITLVFLAGLLVAVGLSKPFHAGTRRSVLLYFWHTAFCVIYALYVTKYGGGDALIYYRKALDGNIDFYVGTSAITFITVFFASMLELSFLGTSLVYNILGFIGLLAFDASLRCATARKTVWIRRLATLIVLLPSVSFWSSAIGKDSLSFMATGFALWAALDLRRRSALMATAVAVMMMVRPHMAGMMVMALAGSLMLHPKVSAGQRIILGGIALASASLMVPFALDYAGVGSQADADDVTTYIEQRQQHNQQGGGGIDISSMSFPMQLFTYMFRPTFLEAFNIFSMAAALDNLLLLFLFLAGGRHLLSAARHSTPGNRTFMWMYALLAWTILAMTTANLGISLRQKWMFAPMLIFLLISLMGRPRRVRAPSGIVSTTMARPLTALAASPRRKR